MCHESSTMGVWLGGWVGGRAPGVGMLRRVGGWVKNSVSLERTTGHWSLCCIKMGFVVFVITHIPGKQTSSGTWHSGATSQQSNSYPLAHVQPMNTK